jgi:hypothetical protein
MRFGVDSEWDKAFQQLSQEHIDVENAQRWSERVQHHTEHVKRVENSVEYARKILTPFFPGTYASGSPPNG